MIEDVNDRVDSKYEAFVLYKYLLIFANIFRITHLFISLNDHFFMTIILQCVDNYSGYTKVCTTQYPKNIGHDLILQKSVELAMYTFALSDINCSTSSSGKSDLNKDGGSYEDNNEDETNNIDDEHADAHIVENSDEGQSLNAKKNLSLPPHWRARQPRLVEKNDLDDNIDYSTDNSDNNQTELNQFHDKVMQFVSSNNNFEKANADSYHKFHQFVISENLIEEYHQPELD